MIPKVIHYCWFGGNPLPAFAVKCIDSWRTYMPDYEIKEWNESNFDVNIIPYTKEAYEAKKYAFVSDYARFWVLHNYGGIYFDTDVEVIRPLDKIIERGAFMGCEIDGQDPHYGDIAINPGLGLAIEAGHQVSNAILERYANHRFLNEDGSHNTTYAIVKLTTDILKTFGLENISGIQHVAGIYIYPKCYFNPFDDTTGRLNKTENTYTIHWFSKTWLNINPMRQWLSRIAHRVFGVKGTTQLRRLFK
ncbi:MAG: glycosyl transferase [Rikenellaceae bacterium]|nr:glycosyl transferase [Rikenellaceae bacterium]